jgi:dienelactone hydrolase
MFGRTTKLGIICSFLVAAACSDGGPTTAAPHKPPSHDPGAPADPSQSTDVDAGDGDASVLASDADAPSQCTQTPQKVTCMYQQLTLTYGSGTTRTVLWQTPLGTAPANGWPVAIVFQGSFLGGTLMWSGDAGVPLGPYAETLTIKQLLDHGYVVITPEVVAGSSTFWDTNIPPYDLDWSIAPDAAMMDALLAAIAGGTFGAADSTRLYAAGVSSGGYMTSRMAVSYAGKFKALAIQSASYATCGGPACVIPSTLPNDHAPTLFLHGQLDPAVPVATMQSYANELMAQGHEVRVVIDPNALHGWIDAAPNEVFAWFDAHP